MGRFKEVVDIYILLLLKMFKNVNGGAGDPIKYKHIFLLGIAGQINWAKSFCLYVKMSMENISKLSLIQIVSASLKF